MANTIQLRRSAVASAVPTTAQLALGELAINTYDGKLYLKKNNGTESIVEIGAGGGGGGNTFLTIAATTGSTTANSTTDTLTIAGGTDITTAIVGDTLTISYTGTGGGSSGPSLGLTIAAQAGLIFF